MFIGRSRASSAFRSSSSSAALEPLAVEHVKARSLPGLIWQQWVGLPAAAARRRAAVLCPGFPPSIALMKTCRQVVPYVHDLFLLSRPETLNVRARHYMRPSFIHMLKTQRTFLVNSMKTAQELAPHVAADARIQLYRPAIRDLFGLAAAPPSAPPPGELVFVAMGTVEPRKNYTYAADVIEALNALGVRSRLRIVGRPGWGPERESLASRQNVELLGHVPDGDVASVLRAASAVLCTSKDEGLGLPLLELQYAGLPTVAVDIKVFREILGDEALLIPPADARAAAERIAAAAAEAGWQARGEDAARSILERYNAQARADRAAVIDIIAAAEHAAAAGS